MLPLESVNKLHLFMLFLLLSFCLNPLVSPHIYKVFRVSKVIMTDITTAQKVVK